MSKDTIYRQDAIDALGNEPELFEDPYSLSEDYSKGQREQWNDDREVLLNLPSAQPDYKEVLGWLLAYHTISFDLHGRYLPHEVISWLINDFTREFIAVREQNG